MIRFIKFLWLLATLAFELLVIVDLASRLAAGHDVVIGLVFTLTIIVITVDAIKGKKCR